jgi:hypothetical protein
MEAMMPMMLMMGMMKGKNGPSSRQKELLKVLQDQEEKIQKMLEEQQNKKKKDDAKGRNQALMERLFQIEEGLLNQDANRFNRHQVKKVDFTELMKGQQLYQQQLIDTLITINKRPKNTVQPTVYLPVPIRDPNLLPPEEPVNFGAGKQVKDSLPARDASNFGSLWQNGGGKSTSRIKVNRPDPSNEEPSLRKPQSIPFQSQPNFAAMQPPGPTVYPGGLTNSVRVSQGQPNAKSGLMSSQQLHGSIVGDTPEMPLLEHMKPNVLRIYKRKKADGDRNTLARQGPRLGPYRISGLRKYAIAAHFIKKLWLNQERANIRYRKESRINFEENAERIYNKTVKFLRQSLSEVLDKAWSLEVPLSFTRRKKVFMLYGIDTNSMGPIHWETVNVILMGVLDGLNKYLNEEYLDPEISQFFGRYCSDRSFLKDNYYFESMLDRLEFDNYEALA